MRAGDADRDRTAGVLRDAHAEGRLDLDELQQRLDATYRARTQGELAALTVDLPSAPPAPTRPAGAPALPRRGDELRRSWTAWAAAVGVNLVIWVLVSLTASGGVYFWPMWVAGPWGAVLLVRTISAR
jgi:hypothetical protein